MHSDFRFVNFGYWRFERHELAMRWRGDDAEFRLE
jgi:hypothetical protein